MISFDSPVDEKIDYAQPCVFWNKVLKFNDPKLYRQNGDQEKSDQQNSDQQNSLVENVAASLSKAEMKIRMDTYSKFRSRRS